MHTIVQCIVIQYSNIKIILYTFYVFKIRLTWTNTFSIGINESKKEIEFGFWIFERKETLFQKLYLINLNLRDYKIEKNRKRMKEKEREREKRDSVSFPFTRAQQNVNDK